MGFIRCPASFQLTSLAATMPESASISPLEWPESLPEGADLPRFPALRIADNSPPAPYANPLLQVDSHLSNHEADGPVGHAAAG
jgi:hypothetical protein